MLASAPPLSYTHNLLRLGTLGGKEVYLAHDSGGKRVQKEGPMVTVPIGCMTAWWRSRNGSRHMYKGLSTWDDVIS
jgi:hypothetical protein